MSSRMTTAALSPSAPGSSTGCSTNRSASSTWWHCGPGVHRSTRLVREHADVLQQLPPAVHRGAVEAYIRTASHKGLTDTDVEALVEPWTGELGQPALYRQIEQADERFTDEVEERYGDIDEPVHIIWGTEDAWIPVDHALRLHAAMPGSSLALIDDAGHLIQLEAPVRLATELTHWTESVR
jgi:pimeloyl-ACP methyl ester carboxylesterase